MKTSLLLVCFLAYAATSLACKSAKERFCLRSNRGYFCMKRLSKFYRLHWTVDGSIVHIGLEGIGAEWVGLGFAEVAGSMNPADVVLGWVDDEGTTVKQYRVEAKSITADDEVSKARRFTNVTATQNKKSTFIAFTWKLKQGKSKIDPTVPVDINYAIGDADELVYHGTNRGSSVVCFGAAPREPKEEPSPEQGPSPKEEKPTMRNRSG